MAEPDNFTFIVYNKSKKKPWACSRRALDCVEELREELKRFSLHEGSVQEGIEKFVEGRGKLENEDYLLKADKIFYRDENVIWKMRNIKFKDYLIDLEK